MQRGVEEEIPIVLTQVPFEGEDSGFRKCTGIAQPRATVERQFRN
jgi:hypothetical protein